MDTAPPGLALINIISLRYLAILKRKILKHMKKRIEILGLFLLVFSGLASANTITWTLSGADADFTPCCSHTFTSGGISITAYGFNGTGTTPNTFLYGRNDLPDDIGLGLDLPNNPSHEITGYGLCSLTSRDWWER